VRRGFATVAKSCLLAAALGLSVVSPALADRAFHARFSTNANGDIAIVGNTLETCQSAAADCGNGRASRGGALNNNGFAMERVDVDNTALDS
jgi:large repetitive protein